MGGDQQCWKVGIGNERGSAVLRSRLSGNGRGSAVLEGMLSGNGGGGASLVLKSRLSGNGRVGMQEGRLLANRRGQQFCMVGCQQMEGVSSATKGRLSGTGRG
jgi:hypothetical protein